MLGAAVPGPGLASGAAARPAVRGERGRWLRRGGSGREGARDAAVPLGVSCWWELNGRRRTGGELARLLAERGLAGSRPPPALAPCPSEVPLVPVLVVGDSSLQVGARRALPAAAAAATGRAASAAAAAACCQQRGRPRLGLRSRLSECLLLGSKQRELGRGGRSFPRARA